MIRKCKYVNASFSTTELPGSVSVSDGLCSHPVASCRVGLFPRRLSWPFVSSVVWPRGPAKQGPGLPPQSRRDTAAFSLPSGGEDGQFLPFSLLNVPIRKIGRHYEKVVVEAVLNASPPHPLKCLRGFLNATSSFNTF